MSNPYENLTGGFPATLRPRVVQYVETGDTTPFRADLDLTTACNYRCAHCGDAAQHLLHRGGLSWEEIEYVLDDLATLKVNEVCLIGGGEPMLSPHFEAAVKGLHDRRIRCGVTTNGSRITPEATQTLAQWAAWVRASVDAATEATYQAVHRPEGHSGLSVVQDALRTLARQMPGRVGASFLILAVNENEIFDAAAQAKDLGLAHIRYRLANHPLTGHILRAGDPQKVREALGLAKTLEGPTFSVSVAEASLQTLQDGVVPAQEKTYTRCHAQAFSVTVAGTGEVYVCSKWRGKPWARLGNIRETRLTEIWSGEQRRLVLESLNPSEACSTVYCHAHAHNGFLESLRNSK